ncbi:Na+/H+ antiporter [Niabella drilacis]|uniref:Monovalent cation:H+ antiporter, CPA1 family n=1 Tax=Niabella drilacis (strain DSM 25811 / CCM 8410 / CCUG 62505 / LMG 26954 / E90) TaxID=1285928 RepID=A0A1G6PUG1_NIADE|nr:Na+/H+ antiporter [Niabella drilacis]SDC83678.1 monovalent cation:H+ antiporter, CPA1 family [Niabella drilacis]
MIESRLLLILTMLFLITLLTMLGNKLKISYPIFLVMAGLVISMLPGTPEIKINPDIVFLIFLPPVLFSAAMQMPWADFWKLKRRIALLGFGLVFFTSTIIAFLSTALIPGFTLALGFVLGGIISPPDAVAATSVLKGLKVPRNVVNLLEGESLVNDASSLIVYRFALLAVISGQFSVWTATKSFFVVAGMGICIGLAIAGIIYLILRFFPTTSAIDTAFTLLSPYVMYLVAEYFHCSGVLSVVAGGLFLSYHTHRMLGYQSRIHMAGVWDTLTFLLNGFIFILIGLQLPFIVSNFTKNTVKEALGYGLIISGAVILIRIVWVYTSNYIRVRIKRRWAPDTAVPTNKETFLVAWCGMRGVVSLAAALAIPFYIKNNVEFPYRYLILFITFVVIIVTLVLQGLTISPLIRLLKIRDVAEDKRKTENQQLKLRLAELALKYIDVHYRDDLEQSEPFLLTRNRYSHMIDAAKQKLGLKSGDAPAVDESMPRFRQLLLELINVKRNELMKFRVNGTFSEELIKEKEWELDLEEARLRSRKRQ